MKKYLTGLQKWFHSLVNYYRRIRYGAGCCDTSNLDHYLAELILPPLKKFRKDCQYSYPNEYENLEAWQKDIDEMIWAFEFTFDHENDFNQEMGERAKRGYALFGKHFRSLWT